MKKEIYKKKPLSYRQWGQIKKEMYRLVLVVAGLVAFNFIISALAEIFINHFK